MSGCKSRLQAALAADSELRKQLQGVEELFPTTALPKGSRLFYDRPATVVRSTHALEKRIASVAQQGNCCVLYPISVDGQRCVTLFDSGADRLFITERKARALGLDLIRSDQSDSVDLPGGCKTQCKLEVQLPVAIKGWKHTFTCRVIEELPGSIDVLLGMPFLMHEKVQANWDLYERIFAFGARGADGQSPHQLTREDELLRAPLKGTSQRVNGLLMTAQQTRRSLRKQEPVMLCVVRERDGVVETDLFGRETIDIRDVKLGQTNGPYGAKGQTGTPVGEVQGRIPRRRASW